MSMTRFNMIDPNQDPEAVSARYRTFLDMASYMDRNGFFSLTLEEHHGVDNGWSPTPLLNAGMVMSRTKNLMVNISAVLLPLYNPIRLAEDLAVVDLASGGRVTTVLALGYRPEEYHLMDKSWENRGKLMDESLEILLKAWSGEAFEYKGEMVQVTPKSLSRPHPMVMIGGSSKAAARRAARFGLPMMTAANIPELEEYYNEKCKEFGTSGICMMPSTKTAMLFVDENPESAWDELGEYFLREATLYSNWQTSDIHSQVHSDAKNAEDLRAEGIYAIRTPEECLELAKEDGDGAVFILHPLCGGMPIERGWDSLKLFTEEVLKKL